MIKKADARAVSGRSSRGHRPSQGTHRGAGSGVGRERERSDWLMMELFAATMVNCTAAAAVVALAGGLIVWHGG